MLLPSLTVHHKHAPQNALTIAYVLTAGSEAMHAMMMEIIFDFGMKNVSTMVLWNVMGQYSKRLTKGNVQR